MKMRYGIFKVIVTCPHCGQPIPVNGPVTEIVCGSCRQKVPIPAESWREIVGEFDQDYAGLEPGSGNNSTVLGDLTLKYTSIRLPPPDPACPKCQTNWVVAEIQNGTDGVITCKQCGRTSPVFPPPDWLAAAVPAARQIFFAEQRDAAGAPDAGAAPDAEAARPIALTCPQCGGGLLVTAESERTVRCKHCSVDVFLPDPVWLKLHPAKTAKFWMVRFQG